MNTPSTDLAVRRPSHIDAHTERRLRAEVAMLRGDHPLIPANLKGKPDDILVVAMYGHTLGLPLMASLRHIVLVNGKPFVESVGLQACAERHHGVRVMFKETDAEKATVIGRKDSDPDWMPPRELTFTIEDAKRANLTGKDTYKSYPAAMLRHRAMGHWIKANAPEVLIGLFELGFGGVVDDVQNQPEAFDEDEILEGEIEPAAPPRDVALDVFVAEWRTVCETNGVTASQSAAVLTKATGGAASKAASVPADMRADALHALQLFVEQMGDAA
jgi:hypothetical protein